MSQDDPSGALRRVVLLGNHLPRQCGIATFTSDLADALTATFPEIECCVVAMNDAGRRHAYGERVRFEIAESDLASYRRATDFLNVGGIDVLCLQHEYGIFGGKAGSHVLELLAGVRAPIVTTLHTILAEPSPEQRRVMDEVTRLSSRLVVMSRRGAELLRAVHGVSAEKIDLIPHGIPTLPSSQASKARLGVEGTFVILTFGLLSPDKGIEYVIDALPSVVARHPNAMYLVLGATHPHVKEWHGESYRRSLELRAHKLGVQEHVVFHDRFVSAAELAEFLSAADVYITPYLNPEQITSGTLAYAVGTGKAVVSTPYVYARELLAEGRGLLVPWRDSGAIAATLERLLGDPGELAALGARAAEFGRDMVWPAVARQYVASFERARRESATATLRRSFFAARGPARRPVELPELDLRHVRAMTDDTGILQHATFSVPRYQDGYCLDDNARALLLATLVEDAGTDDRSTMRTLASRYLAFVNHAFDETAGRFRNFMAYDRRWTEERGSDDSHGRALWALGTVVGRSREPGRKSLGGRLFHAALPLAPSLDSSRGLAFTLLGIHEYLRAFQGESSVQTLQRLLSGRLLSRFEDAADWPWWEPILTYDNARLPQSLIVSGHRLAIAEMVAAGLKSLQWLIDIQRSPEGHFVPIGSNGFYPRGGERARFDRQPIEACATVSACLDAWRVTGDDRWVREMWRAFRWFLGDNHLQASLYDPTTGGCRDGLHLDRPNENQGAESTLSFLLALGDMAALETELRLRDESPAPAGLGPRAFA